MSTVAEPQIDVQQFLADRVARIASVGYRYNLQPKEEVTECPLCGGLDSTVISNRDRFGFPVNARFCDGCGFIYLGPRMTREAYGEFYRDWYRKLVAAHSGREMTVDEIRTEQQQYASKICDICAPFARCRSRKSALDIGGSAGGLAAELTKRWSYGVTVLDPCPAELAKAESANCQIVQGFAEDHRTSIQYDLIAMIQTADHLLDPRKAFANVHEWLMPYGIFVVDFVDVRANLDNWGLEQAIKIDHPLYFTAQTAEMLLRRTGFEIIQAGRSADQRHMVYTCRKNWPEPAAHTQRKFVDEMKLEIAEAAP